MGCGYDAGSSRGRDRRREGSKRWFLQGRQGRQGRRGRRRWCKIVMLYSDCFVQALGYVGRRLANQRASLMGATSGQLCGEACWLLSALATADFDSSK